MEQVTLDEAQRRLPELMRRAAAGERVRIAHLGTYVEMVPGGPRGFSSHPVVSRLRELRRDVNLGGESLKSWIEAGRE